MSTRTHPTFAAAAACLALALWISGCDGPETGLDDEQLAPDPDLPAAVVDLPPPPPASAFEITETNDDGSLRVEGLVANRDKYIDTDVEVRGVVADIRGDDCTPGGPERCPSPHLFIRDHIDETLEMIVVGYDNSVLRSAGISVGDDFLFKGAYTHSAHGFPSAETGLIDVTAIDDHDIDG